MLNDVSIVRRTTTKVDTYFLDQKTFEKTICAYVYTIVPLPYQ